MGWRRTARGHKFNVAAAADRTCDGITFDSKREMTRWNQLKLLERAGKIAKLQRQVRFELAIQGLTVCHYVADFLYFEPMGILPTAHFPNMVVEDCKGHRTEVYKIKRKLMQAIHGIQIRET